MVISFDNKNTNNAKNEELEERRNKALENKIKASDGSVLWKKVRLMMID